MNVPKLRFKEFNDEWSTIELSKISSEISYGMGLASKEYDGVNKYIRITDIDENTNKYSNKDIVSPDGELEDKYIVKKNDILFARTGASTGKTYLYDENDGKLYYAGFLIKANIINHDANFIFQQTKSSKYNKWVKIMSMRSGQPGINSQEYGSYKFSITSKDEEYKISKTLELLDKKIELQSKKIEDLKLFKKGLRDLLINNLEKYNLKQMSEIGFIYNGLSGKSKEDFENGDSKYITFMSVLNNNILESNLGIVNVKNNEKQNVVKKGDIIFNGTSETKEEVGLCSCCNITLNNLYLNSFCFGFRLFESVNYNPEYICDLLLSAQYRKKISDLGQGFTRVNLSKLQLMKIDLKLPSMDIQDKISNVSKKMKGYISLEEYKLNKLNELKKGLMQSMFV